jgi:O-antigen ligase
LRSTYSIRNKSRVIQAGPPGLPTGSSMPTRAAAGQAADRRCASLPLPAKSAGPQASSKNIPLSLLCLAFGPLVYAASLGTVAAMLVLAVVSLIVSRDRLRIVAKSLRVLVIFVPLLAWMLASASWSLDGRASAVVMLRVAMVLAGGSALVTSFTLLPLERLRLPLIAMALGLSIGSAVVAADLALGGHLAFFLHGARPDNIDPALAYGRAATLSAILTVPVLVGLWRLGTLRWVAAYVLLTTIAILETSSLSAKTALAGGLLAFAAVLTLPRLRWVMLAALGFAAVVSPLLFPVTLDADATCWVANHKPSALHRLEIWSFVAERIKERPMAGWGLDAARRLPGGASQVTIHHCDAADRPDGIALSSETLPLHSHNAILQVWLELGGIGVVLGFGPLMLVIWRAFRAPAWRTRPAQAMIAGTITAAILVGLVGFGIWQEWFLSGLCVAAAFVVLAARQSAAPAGDSLLAKMK